MIDEKELIIHEYIAAYNNFDVQKMIDHFAEDVVFENIQQGQVTMRLEGINAFKKQAEEAVGVFSTRQQTIKKFTHRGAESEIEIAYFGILGKDLPIGMKAGEEIKLNGRSIFEFDGLKILKLTDIS